jgi:hypothetical protein
MQKVTGIQGVQGSYNTPSSVASTSKDAWGHRWVQDMYQSLRYNEKEMSRWKAFLAQEETK